MRKFEEISSNFVACRRKMRKICQGWCQAIKKSKIFKNIQKYSKIFNNFSPWFLEYCQDFFQKWVLSCKLVNNLITRLKTLLENPGKNYQILWPVEEKWRRKNWIANGSKMDPSIQFYQSLNATVKLLNNKLK